MKKVAVVILNWNGRSFLEKFLPSVLSNSSAFAEIVVADNASTDDSVNYLKKSFPSVKIVENKINGGFARGYNEALQNVNAEYYVLLNSDVEVSAGWIEPVIKMMDKDAGIAACQPKILSFQNKNEFEYAGAAGGFIDKYGYPFCRGRIFDRTETDQGQYNDIKEIFWASGAALFIRSKIFHEAGGFDVDFFAHMEEIDLCWRIKNTGYKILYCPDSVVYHVGGGTLSKINPRKTYLNFRNNLFLLTKNHAGKFFYFKLFIRLILDGVAGVKFFLSGDVSHCVAVIRAHFSFYGSFSKMIKKRKILQKQITTYSTTGVYNSSIVLDFFIKGRKKFSELSLKKFL